MEATLWPSDVHFWMELSTCFEHNLPLLFFFYWIVLLSSLVGWCFSGDSKIFIVILI